MIRRLLLSFALVATLTASADETFPKPGWKDAAPLQIPARARNDAVTTPSPKSFFKQGSGETTACFDAAKQAGGVRLPVESHFLKRRWRN